MWVMAPNRQLTSGRQSAEVLTRLSNTSPSRLPWRRDFGRAPLLQLSRHSRSLAVQETTDETSPSAPQSRARTPLTRRPRFLTVHQSEPRNVLCRLACAAAFRHPRSRCSTTHSLLNTQHPHTHVERPCRRCEMRCGVMRHPGTMVGTLALKGHSRPRCLHA